ncbi:MAG: phosphatase PAP2 family protein, partial [Clostridia bacterium]|nr:phosphatase PAP2 family protein [Clostridia bacterium]
FSDESIKRVPNLCYATALAIALSSIVVTLLKEPFGRPRFRAMNYAGDFSYYSRWYVLNHQPDKEWMKEFFSSTDACKSFPSGHTQSASMIFCIIMLKELMGIKSKGKTAALWIVSIVWTGAVALSRIMVGAHFFSDVLVGGTIGFIFVIAGREIFVDKFEHIKSLKGKAK